MDHHNTTIEDRVRLIAHSLGYLNPVLYRPTAGRGRTPVDINQLIWELVSRGHKIDMAFASNTPFFGDPHPTDKGLLLWGFSDSGTPNYLSRTAWIYEAKKRLRQLAKLPKAQKTLTTKIERVRARMEHWRDELAKKEALFAATLPHLQKAFDAARFRLQNAEALHAQQTAWVKEHFDKAQRDLAFLEASAEKLNIETPELP